MIRAIETAWRGYRFRSRLEARWAVFFDALKLKWVYEPEGFRLRDGRGYLPDFKLTDFDCKPYVEVKPEGGDFSKALVFHHESGKPMLLLEGQPKASPHILYRESWPDYGLCVAFKDKYIPSCNGGPNGNENRFYVQPEEPDAYLNDYWGVDHVIYAARAARFEFGDSNRLR